ncbi:hypothetical protein BOSE21B_10545 [Bosea sp. 21B]|nr:hypothetical protein BOSE21B_10545 [Bosea sp. 21B]
MTCCFYPPYPFVRGAGKSGLSGRPPA